MRYTLIASLLLITAAAHSQTPDRSLLTDAEQVYAQGRKQEALALIDRYLATDTQNPRAYLLRAVIRAADKQWEEALPDFDKTIALDPKLAAAYQRRGIARFMLGRMKEACEDFDKFNQSDPDAAPQNWQRGIALYYAGRFEDGAKQFELHRTVNPDDVENAAWHFACVARWKSPAAAKAALIPIQGDTRVPMAQIHEMFAGKLTPEQVIAAAKEGDLSPAQLNRQLFYAQLYAGLYCEAIGKNEGAKSHLSEAVKHEIPDYMYGVARVHLGMLKATP